MDTTFSLFFYSYYQSILFQVEELLSEFCSILNETKIFDFDDPSSLDDADYRTMTGLDKCELLQIY